MTAVSPKELEAALRRSKIMERLQDHLDEARQYFKDEQIVGIFLQGSQNYGLDIPTSDIDTKLIVVPSFQDICLNRKPISTTHIRENEEHTDWKDIRLYMETFRKQNLNFLEILFTEFYIINPMYEEQWMRLVEHREEIARMNPFRAVKTMKGIAMEKYHAMEHRYPSKVDLIDQYGYDPKQVSHLVRVEEYLERYIAGELYKNCLLPAEKRSLIMDLKQKLYSLEDARIIAKTSLAHVEEMAEMFCDGREDVEDEKCRDLLEDVSYNIMKIATKKELSL